jgi:hypothetical protein
MERKFYNEFENMLKDHADDFKMYPSNKTWHGIYNHLHPGRKWPSMAMGIMLIGALLIVGRLNNDESSPVMKQQIATLKTQKSNNTSHGAANSNSSTDQRANTLAEIRNETNILADNTVADNGSRSNESVLVQDNSDRVASEITVADPQHDQRRTQLNAGGISTTIHDETPETQLNQTSKFDVTTINAEEEQIPTPQQKKISFPITLDDQLVFDSAKLASLAGVAYSKNKKSRFSLKFHVAPTLSYRDLARELVTVVPPAASLAPGAGPSNPSVAYHHPLDHRKAIGFELGGSVLYDLSKKTKLRAGLQFNYSGYNIHAYKIHPTATTYILQSETGMGYYAHAVSSYSSIPGGKSAILSNRQLQVSLPVGVEFELAQKSKVTWNAAASLQPSYMVVGTAYVASADKRNYISESSLLRNWNVSSALETFVSVKTSSSLTMHLGPQVRYQLISSFRDLYPQKQHLLDFGFKIGVSKKLK